jgi:hypothetical protein
LDICILILFLFFCSHCSFPGFHSTIFAADKLKVDVPFEEQDHQHLNQLKSYKFKS